MFLDREREVSLGHMLMQRSILHVSSNSRIYASNSETQTELYSFSFCDCSTISFISVVLSFEHMFEDIVFFAWAALFISVTRACTVFSILNNLTTHFPFDANYYSFADSMSQFFIKDAIYLQSYSKVDIDSACYLFRASAPAQSSWSLVSSRHTLHYNSVPSAINLSLLWWCSVNSVVKCAITVTSITKFGSKLLELGIYITFICFTMRNELRFELAHLRC